METIFGLKALLIYSCFQHPLSIFNFYTLPLCLPSYPSISSSKLSQFRTCSLLASFSLTLWYPILLCPHLCSARPHPPFRFLLSPLLSVILCGCFVCPETLITTLYKVHRDSAVSKRTNKHLSTA